MKYHRTTIQVENPFSKLIPNQTIAIIPSFELESGVVLYNVPVAYSTRGKLSPQGDNAMVICHAVSGSSDVTDWWGPLLGGPGKAFDVTRFFIVCMNSLGSPYGTASPVTARDGDPSLGIYGPEFPLTTIRDDVRLCKMLLDDLGVKQLAAVVGGSMGGMLVLEFAYFGRDYVRSIVPIATSARHSAWCISWGEAQRQSIYSDPKYDDGYYPYDEPPAAGLGAARMSALLTYRSRDSFESRFGRNTPDPSRRQNINQQATNSFNQHFDIHNEGHRRVGNPRLSTGSNSPTVSVPTTPQLHTETFFTSQSSIVQQNDQDTMPEMTITDPQFHGATALSASPLSVMKIPSPRQNRPTTYFSAQSYLRYQGEKFIKRFDANCYIALTRKLDTHDVSLHCPTTISNLGLAGATTPRENNEIDTTTLPAAQRVSLALGQIQQPTLVLGIESDGLFTFAEQQEIAAGIPNSRLNKIESPEGHDAFLLQFEQVNKYILSFLQEVLPDLWTRDPETAINGSGRETDRDGAAEQDSDQRPEEFGKTVKNSVFGEAEVEDITAW